MDETSIKPEKSTLRLLTTIINTTKELVLVEFGADKASQIKVYFSRKMYFTLGRCWPSENKIAYNLAWVVLNRNNPRYLWMLILHEVAHLLDPSHGQAFMSFCKKYHFDPAGIKGSRELPPVAWLICSNCGDNQASVFSTRLAPEVIKARFGGQHCRICGSGLEYRELSDKSFQRVQRRVRKLRIYGTRTWENLKGLTG